MILVTGATGFLGRLVVQSLSSSGHPVRALVHTQSRASVLSTYNVEVAVGDVLKPGTLGPALEGVDAVIHLVAVIREMGRMTFRQVNYDGTRNILEAAASAGVTRFLHVSAIGVTSDPSSPYLYSRWMAEQEVVRSPLSHTILRFSVGFGEGDEFFNVLAALVKLSPLVPVAGDGRSRFQPIAVEDVARCVALAYERADKVGKTIEVGGPEHVTYDELLDLVADTIGARIARVHIPISTMKPLVRIMETLVPRPPVTTEQLKTLQFDNTTDLDSVEKAFGFVPRPLKGNIDYIRKISLRDALKITLGFMPSYIRDH